MAKKHPYPHKRPKKLPGSVWDNNGYWYWSVTLPGTPARRAYALRLPGSAQTIPATTPKEIAESAAWHAWEAANNGRQPEASGRRHNLNRLATDYLAETDLYYAKKSHDGKPSSQAGLVRLAVGELLASHGEQRPDAVNGQALTALVNNWIARGMVRTTINRYLRMIARFYSWMMSRGHIDAYTEAPVARFPLLTDRSEARESEPVAPVRIEAVQALLPLLTPTLRDMVMVQYICDMRPGEVCRISASQLDTSTDDLWFYEPKRHKMTHKGKLRIIPIFPEARAIIEPYIARRKPDEPLFSAAESYREHLQREHAERKTPMNEGNKPKARPIIQAGNEYQPKAYSHRIREISYRLACEKWPAESGPIPQEPGSKAKAADLAQWEAWQAHLKFWAWTPNQLRHTAATENRALAGKAVAAILLGHAKGSSATDIYTREAMRDEAKEQAKAELRDASQVMMGKRAARE